ncbi:MAG TPA: polyprenyl synthetase family protein [Oscillospiraceae bacterium]|nr:polyprenyl synthetase family protein [Oscillospiraceae bacterium]
MTIAKTPLMELQALPNLKLVEARLQELSRGTDLWTPQFSAAVTTGGKRLRPALVLLCGSFYPVGQSKLVDAATAAELIHTASLVHDDIIDHASLRRGRPTISATWGTQQAVLYGDFLFARAFSILTEHGLASILGKMTRAISLMCEGEIEQSSRLFNCQLQEDDYFDYIYKKTAYFLSACCAAGAEVCGLPQEFSQCLATFGLQLGQAFQLIDDLLDITSDSKTTGKPVLQDLREGYLTLPLIKLVQHPDYGWRAQQIIAEKRFVPENLDFICQSLHDSGIIKETYEKARALILQAKENLTQLPLKPARVLLARLADYVVSRSS